MTVPSCASHERGQIKFVGVLMIDGQEEFTHAEYLSRLIECPSVFDPFLRQIGFN